MRRIASRPPRPAPSSRALHPLPWLAALTVACTPAATSPPVPVPVDAKPELPPTAPPPPDEPQPPTPTTLDSNEPPGMAPDPGRPAFAELTVAHKMLGEGRWQDAQRELQAQLAGPLAQAPIEIALMARSMLGRAYHVQGNQAVAARLYQQVIEAWAKGQGELRGLPPEQEVARLAPALGAVGEALFFQAEQKRAAADALVLNVPRRELGRDAVDRFLRTIVLPYMRAKRSAIEAAERAYTAIAELQPMPPPWWLIAAASRVGELWDAFHAELTALPHPAEWDQAGDSPHVVDGRPLAWAEMRAAYASSLTQATAPFLARARSAYELCARHAERYGVSGEYADHCTAWLDQHAAPLP